MKRSDSLRDGWDIASTNSHVTGVGPRKKERKGQKNVFPEIMAEKVRNLGKETARSSIPESPEQDDPEEAYTRTHYDGSAKRSKKTKKMKKQKKASKNSSLFMYKETPICLSADFQQKVCRPEGSGMIYSKFGGDGGTQNC